MDSRQLKAVAIGAILILEAIALYLGHNGAILSVSIGMIGAIAGYQIGKDRGEGTPAFLGKGARGKTLLEAFKNK